MLLFRLEYKRSATGICHNVNVVVNFFISGNFYFSFVSTSLAYITIPKNKKKHKLPEIKN